MSVFPKISPFRGVRYNLDRIKDVSLVGGKNASLGEMIGSLSSKGVMVPGGFAVTADGYRYYLSENHLDEKINSLLLNLDKNNLKELSSIGSSVRALILNASLAKSCQLALPSLTRW